MRSQNARNHIAQIYSEYASGSDRIKGALQGALQSVQKGFAREGNYLYEFIQNADDAGSSRLQVSLEAQRVVVRNDGNPFSPEDVDALCNVGRSSKSPDFYIGFLGVGYKSVFLISDNPSIHSGQYHFAFNRPSNHLDFPWQVAPEWIQEADPTLPWVTEFLVPLRDSEASLRLAGEMSKESLHNRTILFLASVTSLELVDERQGTKRVIQRESDGDIVKIREIREGQSDEERWILFSSDSIPVPDHIRDDPFTKDWNRDSAVHRAVTIAFKASDDGGLEAVPGAINMGVFSYLPLREEESRLKFVVHADFLTSVGRTRIQYEAPWNKWLAEKVFELIKNTTPKLLSDPRFRTNALEILWPENSRITDFFGVNIEQKIQQFLQTEAELPGYDGSWVKANQAMYMADIDMWDAVGAAEVERLYGRKPIAKDVRVPSGLTSPGPTLFGNSNNAGFVSSPVGETFLNERAKQGDVAFFKLLYHKVTAWGVQDRTLRQAPLARSAIILSADNTIERPNEGFFKPEGPWGDVGGLCKFVHPDLVADDTSRELLNRLGVSTLSQSQINSSRVEQYREEWPNLSRRDRLSGLTSLKEMVESGGVSAPSLAAWITLPTKSGGWVTATNLLFPHEYNPDLNIEPLVALGLIEDVAIEFVDPSLANSSSSRVIVSPMEDWKRFLQQLGVGTPTTNQNKFNGWTAQVGVRMAKQYEVRAGRTDIYEVTEADRGLAHPGYDLWSQRRGSSDERYIEAKGTSGRGEFVLQPTTLHQIFAGPHKDRMFIYVTTGALSSPRIHIIKGDELTQKVVIEIGEIRLQVEGVQVSESINYENLF